MHFECSSIFWRCSAAGAIIATSTSKTRHHQARREGRRVILPLCLCKKREIKQKILAPMDTAILERRRRRRRRKRTSRFSSSGPSEWNALIRCGAALMDFRTGRGRARTPAAVRAEGHQGMMETLPGRGNKQRRGGPKQQQQTQESEATVRARMAPEGRVVHL